MLTFSTSKGPVATARGSVTIELPLLQPTLTFNYTRSLEKRLESAAVDSNMSSPEMPKEVSCGLLNEHGLGSAA